MNSLLILLPVIIVIIISSSIVKLFKYKIEQANFLTVCGITIFLILCGIIGILHTGYYIILAVAAFSLVFLIIIKFEIKKIFTPAISGYLIGLVIYILFSRGSLLFDHDDVVHWAYATKCMYFSDTFYKGLQAMFTPTFNYFVTKTSLHFSETTLFSGAWIIIWSCFILPLKDMEWKDWKKVSLFMVAQYCLLGFLYGNVSLQVDQTMGYMAGALAAYAAINKNKSIKDYLLIIIGLIAISQMKDSFGAVTSMLSAIFIIVVEVLQNFDKLKKKVVMLIIIATAPIAGYFLSEMTINKPAGYLPTESIYNMPVFKLILQSKITLALLSLLVISAIIFFVFLVKNKATVKIGKYNLKLYTIAGVFFSIVLIGVSYKTSSLFLSTFTFSQRANFLNAWKDFFYHTFSGLTNKYLLGIIAVLFGASGLYAIKKELRKPHFIQTVAIFSTVLIYVMFVLVAFSAGLHRSGQYAESISWERYLSTAMIMLITYMIMYFFLSPGIFIDEKKHRLIFISLVMVIVVRYMPYPGIVWNSKAEMTRYGPRDFVERYQEHSDIILSNLDKNDKVFIVSNKTDENSEDKSYGYYPNIYIKYATAPILSNWMYSRYNIDGKGTKSYEKYMQELKKYDYLYVQSAGKQYYDVFEEIYPEDEYYSTKALYKINIEGSAIRLELVHAEDSKILE